MTPSRFEEIIWSYYKAHRRKMPWRETRDPYRILVSEIMLQQTQVARVIGFYEKFIKQFPDFEALSRAKTPDVLRVWQGLGYNRRALALQRLAKEVVEKYSGRLPRDKKALVLLPGIGDYTAGAILAFAFNQPEVFIETNIRRVFIHFFFPSNATGKKTKKKVTDDELRRYIKRMVYEKNPRAWYYALMDYGAMLGESSRNAKASENPNRRSAHYVRQSAFSGSDRQIRGKILQLLLAQKKISADALRKLLGERTTKIIDTLTKEGFLMKNGEYVIIAK